MRPAHPLPVTAAAFQPRRPVPIQIAAGVSPRLARRDRRGVLTLRLAGLAQFRSAAVGAASLICGVVLGGTMRLGARVKRVFAVSKMIGVAGLHEPNVDRGAEHDAPQFEAPGV